MRTTRLDEAEIKYDDEKDNVRRNLAFKSRTLFIIDPQKHFRLILNLPAAVGLSAAEVFRLTDGLQTAEKLKYVSIQS